MPQLLTAVDSGFDVQLPNYQLIQLPNSPSGQYCFYHSTNKIPVIAKVDGLTMSRPKGTAALLEDRRRRALALLDLGYSLNEVGRRIGCAAVSVMRWRDARQRGGETALQVRFSPGRPPKLDSQQRNRLLDLLLQQSHRWTTARIARLIEREFGIRYHRDHVGRLMHSLQWSPYERKQPALERDERGFPRYNPKDLEALTKKPRGWAPIRSISISSSSPRL